MSATSVSGPAASAGAAAFRSGDVLVAATDVPQQDLDFRKGIHGACRFLHCDSTLRVIREFRTGEEGLLVGLARDPVDGTIYATNPQLQSVLRYSTTGEALGPADFLPRRRFGNLAFRSDGLAVIGVHSLYGDAPDDAWGDGKLVSFDPRSRAVRFHSPQIDGGRGGRHCVSNLALAPDGHTVYYVSEAGRTVGRFDIEADRQLEPLLRFAPEDLRGTYGVQIRANGEVLLATGIDLCRYSPAGELVRAYALSEQRGWTRVRAALDGQHVFVGNFLQGWLQKREIETGRVVLELDVQRRGSLTSVLEIP